MEIKEKIGKGLTYLGIELGSTRIKAVLTDDKCTPIASGSYEWENRFENGYWTYSMEDINLGIKECYQSLVRDIREKYGEDPALYGAVGISAMMHGYMAFDKDGNLLVPFRTWRNTTAAGAAEKLSELLKFNIPARWSAAHLYQAVLDREEHVSRMAHITTLAGYINYRLTGDRAVGIGEASGIFPVKDGDYDREKLEIFRDALKAAGADLDLREVLPPVKTAGEKGAFLTDEGVKLLDPDNNTNLGKSGSAVRIPLCPPEGDAGTGMAATNSVRPRTGNISAGTSVFSMLVLDKPLGGVYPEIDIVTTPDGSPVAMVHCNNCCSEIDAWVKMFGEFAALSGNPIDKSKLYELLYKNAMESAPDCSGVTAYNFLSGEPVVGLISGKPMYFRTPGSKMNLGSFFRAQLYSAAAALKTGMDILFEKERVSADRFTGHGGFFKAAGAAQQVFADGLGTPVSVMNTAGEGGAWGMALLAAYMVKSNGRSLADFLDEDVFKGMEGEEKAPDKDGAEGFAEFMKNYRAGLEAEKKAAEI